MTAFLLTMIVVLGLCCIGHLCNLAKGDLPLRTPGSEAINVALNGVLLCWAIVLLVTR